MSVSMKSMGNPFYGLEVVPMQTKRVSYLFAIIRISKFTIERELVDSNH